MMDRKSDLNDYSDQMENYGNTITTTKKLMDIHFILLFAMNH